MSAFLMLLPLIGSIALLVALAKLAAWLYRRSKLSWAHAAGYVVLAVVGNAVIGVLHKVSGAALPLPLMFLAALAFQALLGGWYLGQFGRNADGTPLSFPRGAILAAIYFGLMLAIAVVPAIFFTAVRLVGIH